MVKNLAPAAALLLAAAALTDARAAEQCFCLAHPAGQLLLGCDAKEIPNRVTKQVTCRKDDGSYDMVPIDRPERFTRVEAGVGACNPCNPPLRVVPVDLPRRPGEATGR